LINRLGAGREGILQEADEQRGNGPMRSPSGGLGARLMRSLSAQLASQSVRIVQQILLVPFFLRAWGVDLYNDWLLMAAAAGILSILDGGMQPYFSGLLQERMVRDEIAGYRRAVRIANFNYVAVIAIALLAIAVASLWVEWLPLLGVDHMEPGTAHWTLALLAANFLASMPFGVANSIYRAHGEYDRGVVMGTGNLGGQIIIPLIMLTLGQPSTVLAAGMVGGTIISWVIIAIDQRARYGPLPWGLAIPTAAEQRVTIAKCLYFASQPISTWLTFQGPLLILGHLSLPAETVAFSTARTLIGVSRQMTIQMSYPFGFELSVLLIRDELAALRRLLTDAVSIVAIVGGLLAGVTIVAGEPVTALWLRGRVEIPLELIVIMALPIAISASSQVYQVLLSFTNQPKLIAHGVGIFALVGFGSAIALAPSFGAEGVATGLAIGEVIGMVLYLPARTLRATGVGGGQFHAANVLRAALATLLGYGVGRLVFLMIAPSDYLGLFGFGVLWTVIAGLAAYYLLLNAEQRAVIARRFAALRPRDRGQPPQPAYDRK
jgi:O-antigen/teichoic acid export membrane protein